MNLPLNRRNLLKVAAASTLAATPAQAKADILPFPRNANPPGWIRGRMTGAKALTRALICEGTECVYGIPGAQMNELWDTFKQLRLPYLLCTHEFSASCMADGYARSKGKPGVLCIVPGPGLTNALSGIGEALLDSIPMVCIVGDVAQGDHFRPFQVHALPQVNILRNVTKQVIAVQNESQIPAAVRQAFCVAMSGEPGPVAVVVPYNLLIETHNYNCPPPAPPAVPFDQDAVNNAIAMLSNCRLRVGIYAGLGCMDYAAQLVQVAEMLQAPVATSISGKGVIPETHPLSVGWGYGPQGTSTAEQTFRQVDLVLAIGVRYSEVSTGFYSIPQSRNLIHVDINPNNLGRIMRTSICVHSDAGLFLNQCLAHAENLRRPPNPQLVQAIHARRCADQRTNERTYARCGADPVAFLMALRRLSAPDALAFVDVTCSQYWTTEVFRTVQPRTYFNPTNNQSMGWSIPAAIGAQFVNPGRQTLTITGDGCMLMSAMEISTAARAGLPVKFFILDDQAYHYMQLLQEPAYLRTTATILARLNYASLARGMGVAYSEIRTTQGIEQGIRAALCHAGPVLVRVVTDYRRRPIRWIDAARDRYTQELSAEQKVRFAARIGSRALDLRPARND